MSTHPFSRPVLAASVPIPFWRLAWRTLWRDVRAGELRLLLVALTLAVAALSAVAFFSSRLDAVLRRDAAQLLGGDLVVSSDNPLPAAFAAKAAGLGLHTAQTQTFPTMARAPEAKGGAGRLITLKAVNDAYPLRGALRVGASHAGQASGAAPPASDAQVSSEAAPAGAAGLRPAGSAPHRSWHSRSSRPARRR